MAKRHLKLVAPPSVNRGVTPHRKGNAEMRPREHLTAAEIERVLKACADTRHPPRNRALILIGFRHGLRVSELLGLRWDDVDLKAATLHIRRAKGGSPGTHPLRGDELRALRAVKVTAGTPYIFTSERGGPMAAAGFADLIERLGAAAGIGFKLHPHMLRHSCGYALANRGTDTRTLQAYLGHKAISSTVRYTELAPGRFRDLWD